MKAKLTRIETIEGCAIYHGYDEKDREIIRYKAKFAVCCDGMKKNVYGDPCWQPQTAYQNGGKYLDPVKVRYVVVPPFIISAVDPVVLGSECDVYNTQNKMRTDAICGEVGPEEKLGEGSCKLAHDVGLNPSPNHGGTDEHIIVYTIYVGEPAVVDGHVYKLQPS
jgi:hypothetical protein